MRNLRSKASRSTALRVRCLPLWSTPPIGIFNSLPLTLNLPPASYVKPLPQCNDIQAILCPGFTCRICVASKGKQHSYRYLQLNSKKYIIPSNILSNWASRITHERSTCDFHRTWNLRGNLPPQLGQATVLGFTPPLPTGLPDIQRETT